MDESNASTFQNIGGGSMMSTMFGTNKRKTAKEQYAPNRDTIKRDAQWMLYQHGIDQRSRLVMRNELVNRPHFTDEMATEFEIEIYQKTRQDARLYRKNCVHFLAMIDIHDDKWIEMLESKGQPFINVREIFTLTDKEWIKDTLGWKAFSELEERSKNLQRLIQNRGGLKLKNTDSIIVCKRCMKSNTVFWEEQNRGADEGMTCKVYCKNCRKFVDP